MLMEITESPEPVNKTVIQPNYFLEVTPSAVKSVSKLFGVPEISMKLIMMMAKHNRYMISFKEGVKKLIRNNKENKKFDMQSFTSI